MSDECLAAWRPRPGDWNRSAVSHLFRRAGFGGTAEQIELALGRGLGPTLEHLLARTPASGNLDSLLSLQDLRLLQAWWIERLLDGDAPLHERMALTWHGHFATSCDKVDDVRLMHGQNELFRARGLGDFRSLLREVACDPAMVLWLDGDSNRVGQPNENFARELMELFALGFGSYEEGDVRETARAFTGWGTDRGRFSFRSSWHDSGRKTILGHSGDWDGDEALELLVGHPSCCRHVARRLLTTFVGPDPEHGWTEALGRVLVEQDWHVGRTLEILLTSELFFSDQARRSRIAAPVELLVSVSRTLDSRPSATWFADTSSRMGQALFRPPSVEGWKEGRSWIDVGRWAARHNALVHLVDGAPLESLAADACARAWPAARAALPVPDGDWQARRDAARLLVSPEGQLY